LRAAGEDPYILGNAAFALGLFGENIATAIALIERSLELNPSFARGWYQSGTLRLWADHISMKPIGCSRGSLKWRPSPQVFDRTINGYAQKVSVTSAPPTTDVVRNRTMRTVALVAPEVMGHAQF
jgi:hypothetical protein